MKKCPFCAEEIQDEAIKCKHCGSMLELKSKEPWYFKNSVLIVAFLSVGPFSLPLLWFNPRFSKNSKIVISIVVLIISYYLGVMLSSSISSISKYYQTIGSGVF